MNHPMKLIAKTNRIGLFQNPQKEAIVLNKASAGGNTEEFNLHIDSSHRKIDINKFTGQNIYTTGFVMKSASDISKSYASGGSIRYHDDLHGSHVFELEGIFDTLRTVSDYFRNHRRSVKLNVFTDNLTVVNAYFNLVHGVVPSGKSTKLLHDAFEEQEELLNQFELTVNWEKGHSSKNVANRFADSLARMIRHEGARHNNLTPLQMCGILSRAYRKSNQSVYGNLMNDYMFRLFTVLEKSAVLQIHHSSTPDLFLYKSYYNGRARSDFIKVKAKSIYEVMNIAVETLRQQCSFGVDVPKVYLVGSGFDGVEMFVRDYQKTGMFETKKHLHKFYSNAGVLFKDAVLLGGCCENHNPTTKVRKKHNKFVNDSLQWEKHKEFLYNHYSVWNRFDELRIKER